MTPARGTLMRCVDAKVRKVAPGAEVSDFERRHADLKLLDVMEILTVRKVGPYAPFGDGSIAVWFIEIERSMEGIHRYHANKVYLHDRPFFLDRFVIIRDDDHDVASPSDPAPREKEHA